jgi:polyhydroxyalkanoate synthesis regulator phasin
MPATKSRTRTRKKQAAPALSLDDLRKRADRVRKDLEDTVESLGKRAAGFLPASQRKQVDEVLDRLSEVRGDLNKTVEAWRKDFDKQFKVMRGTVDKRVTKLRKQTEKRGQKAISEIEKEARKYTARAFKRLQIPVRSDIESIKRRLTALERRLTAIEKHDKKAAAA